MASFKEFEKHIVIIKTQGLRYDSDSYFRREPVTKSWNVMEWLSWENFKMGIYHADRRRSKWLSICFIAVFWFALPPVEPQRFWKPITLRWPVLGGFVLTSISFVIILEILSDISSKDGALAFAPDVDGLSTAITSRYAALVSNWHYYLRKTSY